MIRFLSAIATSTAVTLALLYVMQLLIDIQPGVMTEPPTALEPPWRDAIEETIDTSEFDLPDLHHLLERVEPDPPRTNSPEPGTRAGVRTPHTAPTPSDPDLDATMASFDGPLVAIVRVQPTYPVRASQSDLEGYVIVEFDVAENGTVQNVRVIESSHRIFEKAAVNAAEKFRYKARVVDGVPQPSYGLRNRFTFEMDRA